MTQGYNLKLDPRNCLLENKEIFHEFDFFDVNEEIRVSETNNTLRLSNKFTESIKNYDDDRDERKQFIENISEILYNEKEKDSKLIFSNNDKNDKKFFDEFSSYSQSIWVIESLNIQKGGIVKWKGFYRLKHLISEKYLAVSNFENVYS